MEIPELTFMADKNSLRSAATAMMAAVAHMLGRRDLHDITNNEILRNGALVVVKQDDDSGSPFRRDDFEVPGHSGIYNRPENDRGMGQWSRQHSDSNFTVEPGDYYSSDSVGASYVLTGNKLATFLQKQGLWPLTSDAQAVEFMKSKLIEKGIQIYRLRSPQMPVDQIRQQVTQTVSAQTPDQIQKHYATYYPGR